MEKKFWESKTVWVNAAIAAGTAAANVFGAAVPAEIMAVAVPLVNIFLRFLSSKKISL